jgi:ADP-heptose:LPS heptosyltransferase
VDKDRDNTLLVIRLSAMGDVAMTVPVLLSLVRHNPFLKLVILTRPFFAPIFRDIPNIEVIIADLENEYRGIGGLFALAKHLRRHRFNGVADLHNVLRTKILKVFFVGSGVPFVQLDKGRKEKSKLTRWGSKEIEALMTTHERYAAVFRQMGFALKLDSQDVLERRQVSKAIEDYLPEGEIKLIGIAPFAAFQSKMYPLEFMEEVLIKLADTKKYKIIVFGGGAKEIKTLKQLEKKYTNCYSVGGRLAFKRELDLISHLDLMVAMDSGNGHLAAMFGVPTITLWGNTHPFTGFAPFGQPASHQILSDRTRYPLIPTSVYGRKVPEGYDRVMESIHPDMVVEKILSTLR